jgi:hypothetical protein
MNNGEDCCGDGQYQRPYRQREGTQVGDMSRPRPIVQSNNGLLDGKNAPLLMRVRVEIKLCQRIILNVVFGGYGRDLKPIVE